MRYPALLTAALAISTFAACTPPAPRSGTTQEPAASSDSASARRTWEARHPAAYAYELEISCLCIHRGRYAVEVRDGELASVRDATTGAPSPESRVSWILTPDWLFRAMAQAAQLGTPLRAVYHPELGYPTEAEIGLLADDSGTLYRIENLRPL
jgi:hypothetical protein